MVPQLDPTHRSRVTCDPRLGRPDDIGSMTVDHDNLVPGLHDGDQLVGLTAYLLPIRRELLALLEKITRLRSGM